MMRRALWLMTIGLISCSPQAEPAKAPEAETTPPPAPVVDNAAPASAAPEPEAPAPVPEAAAEPAPAVEAPPPPALRDVCYAMCDKVKAKCPKSAFESCRVNCTKYDPPPDGCDDVVRGALECARDAADLVCANVAPESCMKRFRQITACAAGEKPSQPSTPAKPALPEGFALYENASEGVRAPMPEGAGPGNEPGVLASAKTASGAVYEIRKLPRPEGKLNEKAFLKLGLNLLGRCSDKMKLSGMVDKPGRTSINYTTKCPDGSREVGVFWGTEKSLYVARVRGSGELGPTDSFVYGFEVK